MPIQKLTKMALMIQVIGFALFFLLLEKAHSVPSFERQTGMECTTCHTIFPDLKPFGRIFKLGGYVFSKSSKPHWFAFCFFRVICFHSISNRISHLIRPQPTSYFIASLLTQKSAALPAPEGRR